MADQQRVKGRIRKVVVSWRTWNEYHSWRPRIDRGAEWMGVKWAWFYVQVER